MRIFENVDCMEGMEKYKDILQSRKTLAIVDPPYEQQWGNLYQITSGRTDKLQQFHLEAKKWDKKPTREYFNKLKRVSIKQIIWGYNYFTEYLGNTNDLIMWDKEITGNENFLRFEIAYCSFNTTKIIKAKKEQSEDKIHPTQKPIALYKWLLENYAKGHDLILDTHVGSASSLIACEEFGIDYIGFELDTDYYSAAKERLEKARFIRENKKADECFVNDLALFAEENKK